MARLTAALTIIGCAGAVMQLVIAPYVAWIWSIMPAVALALGSK